MRRKNGVLYLIILFALALRLYGINYDVPHPDDYTTVQGAMYFGPAHIPPTGYGLDNLHSWPGVTLVYFLTVLSTLYFFIGKLTGFFSSVESFGKLYLSDPSSFYLIGHIMSALFGAATVLILYFVAKRLYNREIGLMASLFLSGSFIHSFHSQFIRPDVPTTFFALLTILCCLLILETKARKYYIYTGIVIGMAIATKFTGGVLVLTLIISYFLAERDELFSKKNKFAENNFILFMPIIFGLILIVASILSYALDLPGLIAVHYSSTGKLDLTQQAFVLFLVKAGVGIGIASIIAGLILIFFPMARYFGLNLLTSKNLISGIAAVIISFAVFDPIFFVKFKQQLYMFIYMPTFMGENTIWPNQSSLGPWNNFLWYLKGSLRWGSGIHMEIMAILGLLIAFYQWKKEDTVTLIFPALSFIAICFGSLRFERWVIPLMPFMAMYAALFLYVSIEKIGSKYLPSRSKSILFAIASIIVILPSTYNILRYDYMLTHKDTRVMSKEWVEKNIPKGSRIGQDAYTGEISDTLFDITKKYSLGDESFEYYVQNKYQYLMVSDTQYKRFLEDARRFPENAEFYKTLFSRGELIKQINPRQDLWPKPEDRFSKYHIHFSPEIRIYRINDNTDFHKGKLS